MSRRGHGEGSISKRKDGRWEARIDLGWENGKRKRHVIYGKTRREVQEKLHEARQHQHDGVLVSGPQQTLKQYLERWLEDTAQHTLRPRTFVRYRQLVELHALPRLGKFPLSKLAPQQLNQLYGKKLEEGLSPRTVQFLHAVLHKALRQAVKWNLIGRNPADAVDAPRPERSEIQPLTPDQARKLLDTCAGDPLEALYVLAVTTGMRQGELLGLRWSAIDRAAGRLGVRHTLQRLPGGWQFAEPKTERSRRSIRLSKVGIDALRTHRAHQVEARLRVGPAWEDNDLVFCDAFGRPLDGRHVTSRCFKSLLACAELPSIRFHDLRHTAATLMPAQDVHPQKVQDMLGHSTISLTMDTCSHVLPGLRDEVAEKMDRLLATGS